MASLTFFAIKIEGDADTCRQALSVAIEQFLPKNSGAAVALNDGGQAEAGPARSRLAVDPPAAPDDPPVLPASPEISRKRPGPRRGVRRISQLVCEQLPGRTFTIDQAAEFVKVKPQSIRSALSPNSPAQGRVGGYTFRRAEDAAAPAPNHEARPRSSGESMPFNPNRVGAGAPVYGDPTPAPQPTFKPRS